MREIKIITVPFDSNNGIFDDEGLQAYLRVREVLYSEPRFFENEGRSFWSVYLETRTLQGAGIHVKVDDSRRERSSEEMAFRQLLRELDEIESVRYRSLVQWRREKAHQEGVPPYIILTNRQCLDIARGVPRTLEGLGQVKGIGKKRIKKHGRLILEVLHGNYPETGPGPAAVRGVDGDDKVAHVQDGKVPEETETQHLDANREPLAGDTRGDNDGGLSEEQAESIDQGGRETVASEGDDAAES